MDSGKDGSAEPRNEMDLRRLPVINYNESVEHDKSVGREDQVTEKLSTLSRNRKAPTKRKQKESHEISNSQEKRMRELQAVLADASVKDVTLQDFYAVLVPYIRKVGMPLKQHVERFDCPEEVHAILEAIVQFCTTTNEIEIWNLFKGEPQPAEEQNWYSMLRNSTIAFFKTIANGPAPAKTIGNFAKRYARCCAISPTNRFKIFPEMIAFLVVLLYEAKDITIQIPMILEYKHQYMKRNYPADQQKFRIRMDFQSLGITQEMYPRAAALDLGATSFHGLGSVFELLPENPDEGDLAMVSIHQLVTGRNTLIARLEKERNRMFQAEVDFLEATRIVKATQQEGKALLYAYAYYHDRLSSPEGTLTINQIPLQVVERHGFQPFFIPNETTMLNSANVMPKPDNTSISQNATQLADIGTPASSSSTIDGPSVSRTTTSTLLTPALPSNKTQSLPPLTPKPDYVPATASEMLKMLKSRGAEIQKFQSDFTSQIVGTKLDAQLTHANPTSTHISSNDVSPSQTESLTVSGGIVLLPSDDIIRDKSPANEELDVSKKVASNETPNSESRNTFITTPNLKGRGGVTASNQAGENLGELHTDTLSSMRAGIVDVSGSLRVRKMATRSGGKHLSPFLGLAKSMVLLGGSDHTYEAELTYLKEFIDGAELLGALKTNDFLCSHKGSFFRRLIVYQDEEAQLLDLCPPGTTDTPTSALPLIRDILNKGVPVVAFVGEDLSSDPDAYAHCWAVTMQETQHGYKMLVKESVPNGKVPHIASLMAQMLGVEKIKLLEPSGFENGVDNSCFEITFWNIGQVLDGVDFESEFQLLRSFDVSKGGSE